MIRSPCQKRTITREIQHVRASPFVYIFPQVSAQYTYHFSSIFLNLLIINNGEKISLPYLHLVLSCPGDNQHWWDAFPSYLGGRPLDREREKWNREGEWRMREITHWTPTVPWQGGHPNRVPQRKGEPYKISDLALWCVERSCNKKVHSGIKRKQKHRFLQDASTWEYPDGSLLVSDWIRGHSGRSSKGHLLNHTYVQ